MHILAIYRRIRPIRAVNDLRSDFITSFRCDELHCLALVPRHRNGEKRREEKNTRRMKEERRTRKKENVSRE